MNSDFHNIVLEIFKDVIADYRFKVDHATWWLIELTNDKCILRLIYDTGFTEAQFVYPKEKEEREAVKRADGFPSSYPLYPIYSVWKYLYPGDRENFQYNGYNIEEQATTIKRLLLERMTNILKGDFSWVQGYKQPLKNEPGMG